MVATAEPGTMTFLGMRSRMSYVKDIYIADVDGALIHFDGGAGASATSPQDWTPPEGVVLVDLACITGSTVTTKLQLARGGLPTGDFLRLTMHLNTLATRPRLAVVFPVGRPITAIERA